MAAKPMRPRRQTHHRHGFRTHLFPSDVSSAGRRQYKPCRLPCSKQRDGYSYQTESRTIGSICRPSNSVPGRGSTRVGADCERTSLLGALIDNYLENITQYDDEKFWPVLAIAEKLDVPIYLHPFPPSPEVVKKAFMGNYSMQAAFGFSTAAWGWHENVGLHVLKLYKASLFVRFPGLKIVIGRMGRMMPFMLDRVERMPFLKAGSGEVGPSERRSLKVVLG